MQFLIQLTNVNSFICRSLWYCAPANCHTLREDDRLCAPKTWNLCKNLVRPLPSVLPFERSSPKFPLDTSKTKTLPLNTQLSISQMLAD